jgi:hypothetical protein
VKKLAKIVFWSNGRRTRRLPDISFPTNPLGKNIRPLRSGKRELHPTSLRILNQERSIFYGSELTRNTGGRGFVPNGAKKRV